MSDGTRFVQGMFIGGVLTATIGALVLSKPAEPESKLALPVDLALRVAALEESVAAQAKVRCMNITTPRMDLAVFPVENLGVEKVRKK
jgi:hypothetical protein